jgi:hypothetical protein
VCFFWLGKGEHVQRALATRLVHIQLWCGRNLRSSFPPLLASSFFVFMTALLRYNLYTTEFALSCCSVQWSLVDSVVVQPLPVSHSGTFSSPPSGPALLRSHSPSLPWPHQSTSASTISLFLWIFHVSGVISYVTDFFHAAYFQGLGYIVIFFFFF